MIGGKLKSIVIFVIVLALTAILVVPKIRGGLEKADSWIDSKIEKIKTDSVEIDTIGVENVRNDSI